MSKRQMKGEQERQQDIRGVAKSRPLRTSMVLISGNPEPCCPNSDASSMVQLDAAVWNKDDVRSSEERQGKWDEPICKNALYAPKVQGNGTTGDLAFVHISNSRKFSRNFRLKFMVPENVKHDFSVNEATRSIWMNSCMWAAVHLHPDHDQDRLLHSLRNTNVEKIQQMFTTTERRNADLQPKESAGLSGQRSWEESLLSIMHITAQRYLQTIYSQGVCLYRSCAVSWRENSRLSWICKNIGTRKNQYIYREMLQEIQTMNTELWTQ